MSTFFSPLLTNDRTHAFAAEIGTTIKPTTVSDNATVVVVAPITRTVSTDSVIEVCVSHFQIFFFFDV